MVGLYDSSERFEISTKLMPCKNKNRYDWIDLKRIPALDNADEDDDHGRYEENVHEPADGIDADDAEEPKD
jgi:hypothetical protein